MSDPRREITTAEAKLGYEAPLPAGGNSYSPTKLFVVQALGLWILAEDIVWGPSNSFWRAVDRGCYEPLCRENELQAVATRDTVFTSTFPIATRMLKATPFSAWGERVNACGVVPIITTNFLMEPNLAFAHNEIAFYDPTGTFL